MHKRVKIALVAIFMCLLFSAFSGAENLSFKAIDSKIAEYRSWLDQAGSTGSRFWVRLDSTKRPHRLYVGEGFKQANYPDQEKFIEIFSRFLAGHPEKNMLIDIYDPVSEKWIGEYGFGGFRLF